MGGCLNNDYITNTLKHLEIIEGGLSHKIKVEEAVDLVLLEVQDFKLGLFVIISEIRGLLDNFVFKEEIQESHENKIRFRDDIHNMLQVYSRLIVKDTAQNSLEWMFTDWDLNKEFYLNYSFDRDGKILESNIVLSAYSALESGWLKCKSDKEVNNLSCIKSIHSRRNNLREQVLNEINLQQNQDFELEEILPLVLYRVFSVIERKEFWYEETSYLYDGLLCHYSDFLSKKSRKFKALKAKSIISSIDDIEPKGSQYKDPPFKFFYKPYKNLTEAERLKKKYYENINREAKKIHEINHKISINELRKNEFIKAEFKNLKEKLNEIHFIKIPQKIPAKVFQDFNNANNKYYLPSTTPLSKR